MDYTSLTTCGEKTRTHTKHLRSETEWNTDIPTALGGLGHNPAPAEMLAATVATCMVSFISFLCSRHNVSASGLTIHSAAEDKDGSITRLFFHVTVPASLNSQRKLIEEAVNRCPVKKALDPAVLCEITWEWC